MPSPSLPPGFTWLSPDFRPSPQEVKAYASVINEVEAGPIDRRASLREAELQLWIWRTETRQPPPRRRRSSRPAAIGADLIGALPPHG